VTSILPRHLPRHLVAATAMAALLAAGCGGGNDVEVSGPPTTDASVATTGSPRETTTAPPQTTVAPDSGGTTTAPASSGGDDPSGWQRLAVPGFSIAVPPGWEAPDLGVEDIGDFLRRFSEQFPEAELPPGVAEAAAEIIKLFAIDPDTNSNVNVIVTPGEVPVDLIADQAGSALEQQFGTDVTVERITVDGDEAVQATIEVPGDQGTLTQIYVSGQGQLFIVTVTDREREGLAPEIRETIRLG
jgi:hypothetical protein